MPWSDATIQKALKLKFSCGKAGYEMLLEQGQPLPSLVTLRRRLNLIEFDTGILPSVFHLLHLKVSIISNIQGFVSFSVMIIICDRGSVVFD